MLDEPTDGLDPNQKHEVRGLIRRMGATKAIIFSTHILEEVDAVCTRAIIIDRGKIVANGTPAELRQKSETAGAVTLRVQGVSFSEVSARLSGIPQVKRVADARRYKRRRRGAGLSPIELRQRRTRAGHRRSGGGWRIEQLQTEEGRLDEVFRSLTMPDTVNQKTGVGSQRSETGSRRPEGGGRRPE